MVGEFASDTNSGASHFAPHARDIFARPAKLAPMVKPLTFLREARQQAKLTLEDAAAALARSGIELSPGQLSRIERGESDVARERLVQLGRLYGWTPAELLAGRSDVDDHGRPRAQMVPLIDSVQAGHWTEVADPYEKGDALDWVPVRRRVGPRAFALQISGQSMLPDFRDRDIIIVDPDIEAQPGYFVVARADDENAATFKRYRQTGRDNKGRPIVELVPLNPDWPTIQLKGKDSRIVGVAVDHYRSLV
jgi:SOS-response transcriptional repressor LexA